MPDTTSGVESWKEHTGTFDRVQSVVSTVSQPRSAPYIADEAHVAENTARKHLERLVDLNVLLKSEQKETTLYSPDPLHTRMQTLRDLLEKHDRNALIDLKADLQFQVESWRDEYDADSPDDLRGRAVDTDTAAQTRDIRKTASDWELTLYRLSVVEDAIKNYTTYSQDSRGR